MIATAVATCAVRSSMPGWVSQFRGLHGKTMHRPAWCVDCAVSLARCLWTGGPRMCPGGACRHSACADKSLAISLRKCWMLSRLRPSRISIQACPCARRWSRTGLWLCSVDQPAGVVMLAGYRLDAHVTTCAVLSGALSWTLPVEPELHHASQRTQTRTCDTC